MINAVEAKKIPIFDINDRNNRIIIMQTILSFFYKTKLNNLYQILLYYICAQYRS